MDYSAANTALWNVIIQFGILALALLAAIFLRRQLRFFRRSLLPAGVLGGFLLLILKSVGVLRLDGNFLEMVTYHFLAIAFIAMSLRINARAEEKNSHIGLRSGAFIVSVYLVQAITGIVVCLLLAWTVMPDLFKAAGVLLPMGYGQGPGQAGNIGSTYEALGFKGGHSFGLGLAASGFLVAAVVGVIMLNVLVRQGKIQRVEHEELADAAGVGAFQDPGEMPISESMDRFSMQMALVLVTYLITYLVTWGITSAISAAAPGLGKTVNTLLWGFNFIYKGQLDAIDPPVVYTFEAAMWTVSQGEKHVEVPWRATPKLHRSRDCLFIYNADVSGNLLPKRLMTQEQMDAIRTWFDGSRQQAKAYEKKANEAERAKFRAEHPGLRLGRTGPAWGPRRKK